MVIGEEPVRVDLRGLPTWERPNVVFEAFDRLDEGGELTVVSENEPRGLCARLLQSRKHELFLEPRRMGDREWQVRVKRTHADHDVQSPAVVIARCALFSELSASERARILDASKTQSVRRGETLIVENEEWPYIGVVIDGVLAVSGGKAAGRERIFYEVFPYEIFGEAGFFDRTLSSARVSAHSKHVKYLEIPRDVVMQVGCANPDVLVHMGSVISQRARGLADALVAQATLPILARIAQALLPYAMPEQGLTPAVSTLLNVTQAQIAASAGTVKEVAARAIAELEERGLLRRERGHIRYLDRQRLVDLVRELS